MINEDIVRYSALHRPTLTADHWLQRAKMTRAKAAATRDPRLQDRLRRVALEYERLAKQVQQAASASGSADDGRGFVDEAQLSLAL